MSDAPVTETPAGDGGVPLESAEPIAAGLDLVPTSSRPVGLFGAVDAERALALVEEHATALKRFVLEHDLALEMETGEWVTLPGWEALGAWLGVFAVVDPDTVVQIEGGWRAYARAVTRAGEVVGGEVGLCLRSEDGKRYAPEHDLCATAQARARRNALRSALSVVVSAAGFDTVDPAEKPITPRQRAKLFALLRQLSTLDDRGRSEKELKEWVTQGTLTRFGKRISGLTRGEAKRVIDGVQRLVDERLPDEERSLFEPRKEDPEAEAIPFG